MKKLKFYEYIILRVPIFPFQEYLKITNEGVNYNYINLIDNSSISSAIYMASEDLYFELKKVNNSKNKYDSKIRRKIETSIYKYFSRMCTRSTPFGMFSGVSVLKMSDESSIIIDSLDKHIISTNVKQSILSHIIKEEENNLDFIYKNKYRVNNSYYLTNTKMRYIERYYSKKNEVFKISEIDRVPILEELIDKYRGTNVLFLTLKKELLEKGITDSEANSFLQDLIKEQILINSKLYNIQNELEHRIFKGFPKISKLKNFDKTISYLINFKNTLDNRFVSKRMFQADTLISLKENFIDQSVVNNVQKGIRALNKISKKQNNYRLENFKQRFRKKYDFLSVNILELFDNERGLNYKDFNDDEDSENSLIKSLLKENQKLIKEDEYSLSFFEIELLKKKEKYNRKIDKSIKFFEKDFSGVEENWNSFPSTFNVLVRLFTEDGIHKVYIDSVGGNSATNLIGRFTYLDCNIENLYSEILFDERRLNKDFLNCEIVHIQDTSISGVLYRPIRRDYKIEYLGNANDDKVTNIGLQDVSVTLNETNQFVLKWKNSDLPLKLYMSCAHNYQNGLSLSLYSFLCDLQNQDKNISLTLGLSDIFNKFEYFPRIELENVVLREARWCIGRDNFNFVFDNNLDVEKLKKIREMYDIPRFTIIWEGDNEFVVDWESKFLVDILRRELKFRDKLFMKEFLFTNETIIKNIENQYFANELILSVCNE